MRYVTGLLQEAKSKAAMQRLQTQTRMLVNADQNRKAQERSEIEVYYLYFRG